LNEHLKRGEAFGVHRRDNYSLREIEHFKVVPCDIVPAPTRLNLPFEHLTRRGFAYKILLVEPQIFLSKLHRDLEAGGTRFVQKELFSESDVLALPANIIVNCTGLGSDAIWQDKNLIPIKGSWFCSRLSRTWNISTAATATSFRARILPSWAALKSTATQIARQTHNAARPSSST
jgi:hypothetical protein